MKKKILSVISLLFVGGCATVGDKFCGNNGYAEDTPVYKQCVANYNANRDIFQYCEFKKGLVLDGPELQNCLAEAKILKRQFDIDQKFCQSEASNKLDFLYVQSVKRVEPFLSPSGDLKTVTLELNERLNPHHVNDNYKNPFINNCMSIHGWHNAGVWQDNKVTRNLTFITKNLSVLNKAEIITEPEIHPTVELYSAIYNNDPATVEGLIISNNIDINISNHQGYRPIHIAARIGNLPIMQLILERFNADPYVTANDGNNVIAMASLSGNIGAVQYVGDHIKKIEIKAALEEMERRREEERKREVARLEEIEKIRIEERKKIEDEYGKKRHHH